MKFLCCFAISEKLKLSLFILQLIQQKIEIDMYYINRHMIKKSFRVFAVPLFTDNYSYIVQTSVKDPLLLVDPANPQVILDCLNRYFSNQQVGHILYTHKHWDHAGGAEDLFKILSAKEEKLEVYSGAQDAMHIKTVTQQIQSDEQIKVGPTKMRVYKVPCHTRGHVIYHMIETETGVDSPVESKELQTSQGKKIRVFEQSQCAFSGDTLFCGAIGKFFEGDAAQMYTNLKKINENLNKNCSIFNGHEYTLQAIKWGLEVQPQNQKIKELIGQIQSQDPTTVCTLPTTTARESQVNVFFKAVLSNQNKLGVDGVEYLRVLRQAKNNNSADLQKFLIKKQ